MVNRFMHWSISNILNSLHKSNMSDIHPLILCQFVGTFSRILRQFSLVVLRQCACSSVQRRLQKPAPFQTFRIIPVAKTIANKVVNRRFRCVIHVFIIGNHLQIVAVIVLKQIGVIKIHGTEQLLVRVTVSFGQILQEFVLH